MNRHLRTLNLVAAAALWAGLAAPAHAQALINHSKALAGAVTPGDAPGYPITLSRAGHYKLSGNLTVPAGVNGIEITASHVTLDLNGFTVSGAGSCVWNQPSQSISCSGGTGTGVSTSAVSAHLTLRNGSVRGFSIGVYTAKGGRLSDLTVTENGYDGALLTTNITGTVVVERSSFSLNGRHGVSLDDKGLLQSVTSERNGGSGIVGAGAENVRVADSFLFSNRGFGAEGVTVQGTQLRSNVLTNRNVLRSAGGNADDSGVF